MVIVSVCTLMILTFISTVASILPLRPYLERINEQDTIINNHV